MIALLTILAAIGFVILAAVLIAAFARQEGYFSTLSFFAGGCFVYYVAIPVDLAARHLAHASNPTAFTVSITDAQMAWVVVMAAVGLVAWAIGYRLSGFAPWADAESGRMVGTNHIPLSLMALPAVAVVALVPFLYLGHLLAGLENYTSQGTRVVYDNPLLAVLLAAIYVPLGVIGAIWMWRRRAALAAIALVALMAAASVLINRKEALATGLLVLSSPVTRWRLTVVQSAGLFVAAVILGLLAFNAYSLHRGGAEVTVQRDLFPSYGLVEGSDAGGPFSSIEYVFGGHQPLLYGRSYLDVAILVVPKAIWPGRPMDLAQSYARATIPGWSPGRGTGFSLLAEAYLNFSSVGVALQFFLLGWGWGIFWKWLRRVLIAYSAAAWQGLYATLGFLTLLTMHRATVATGLKTFAVMVVPVILASLVIDGFGQSLLRRLWAMSPLHITNPRVENDSRAAAPASRNDP